ncbi:MAG TPA: DUF4058 family protein [Gemmataceae bacterium]|nr:DUF4058 family protein [Gemmataceae bacterium]
MPLRDHFHGPFSKLRHWEGFHSAWANMLVGQLNHGVLPRRYVAEPHITLGVQVESDVVTFEKENEVEGAEGGGGTAVYAPPRAPVRYSLDFAELDLFEIRIHDEESAADLAAVIEFISPANKDRPSTRQVFAIKCASYLENRVGVMVVDIVTARRANLHTELLTLLGHPPEGNGHPVGRLYAVSYRTVLRKKKLRLEAWPETLTLGRVLPTLPLWLAVDCVVPVDLEKSYLAACDLLRIPPEKA